MFLRNMGFNGVSMPKIMCEMVEGYYQYATQIDSRVPLSKNNIGYSIYPHRAIDGSHIDRVRETLPDFNFQVKDNGR